MLIDFHVHFFDERIAARAMAAVGGAADIVPETDGTAYDTRAKLRGWGVDRAVLLPIATKASQQRTINDWAKTAEDEMFLSFGSVFPDAPDALAELSYIKQIGLRGVKLHPDYQGFFAGDEAYFPLYEACAALGLPLVFHAGYDPASPEVTHGLPEDFAKIADAFPTLTLILAHLGGENHWDEVEDCIVGRRNVYLDTAYGSRDISAAQFERIVRSHGADRILFASDCPWDSPAQVKARIDGFGLTDAELALIYHGNAQRILELEDEGA